MSDTPNSPAKRSGCLIILKLAVVLYLLVSILVCGLLFALGTTMDNAIAMSLIWPYYLPMFIIMAVAGGAGRG